MACSISFSSNVHTYCPWNSRGSQAKQLDLCIHWLPAGLTSCPTFRLGCSMVHEQFAKTDSGFQFQIQMSKLEPQPINHKIKNKSTTCSQTQTTSSFRISRIGFILPSFAKIFFLKKARGRQPKFSSHKEKKKKLTSIALAASSCFFFFFFFFFLLLFLLPPSTRTIKIEPSTQTIEIEHSTSILR
jgi:hypothetical protein